MSWLYSQALVVASLGENSLAGEPYAPSNGTPTPQAFLCNAKTTAAWTRFPSGMTCKPLTDDHGEDLLMLYRAGFHAPTYPPPAKEPALTAKNPECGSIWPESLAKFDPNTSSWRTAQCLLFEDLGECLETFPNWGMMHEGGLWELTCAEPIITAPDGGWLPTPTCADAKNAGGRQNQYDLSRHAREITGKRLSVHYSEWTMDWPVGWTDITPLETDKFQQWQQQHSEF